MSGLKTQKMIKEYERVATANEVDAMASKSHEEIAEILDGVHVVCDNAMLLAVVEGIAYPIREIAENH